jgi:hypothetical protein
MKKNDIKKEQANVVSIKREQLKIPHGKLGTTPIEKSRIGLERGCFSSSIHSAVNKL